MTADRELLLQAVAAWELHRTPARLLDAIALEGADQALARAVRVISPETLARATATAERLARLNVGVLVVMREGYPVGLLNLPAPPPILFYIGNPLVLEAPAVGMCGSRSASEAGLEAARNCGLAVARAGLTIISGYARGVDVATHLAALEADGRTIIVLAEGILQFRIKEAFGGRFDLDRVLVLSQFPPAETWNVGSAMARNAVIAGIGRALVVIEAQEKGGTLDAGLQALVIGRPVLTLEFESSVMPGGNRLLIAKGAKAVRRPTELTALVTGLRDPEAPSLQLPLALA